MAYRVGVDVGGTFTDVILVDVATSTVVAKAKVPSTPAAPQQAVITGINEVCAQVKATAANVASVFHGTTVATNAVLEGKGARVALVTSRGHKQVLHIGRSFVPGGLGGWITWQKPEVIAPLECTVEADERVDARGNVVRPLDVEQLRADLAPLATAEPPVEAVTVSLLNAYLNGEHEVAAREVVKAVLPGVPVSISSEVLPEMYEYERTLTTVANSFIRPVVSR